MWFSMIHGIRLLKLAHVYSQSRSWITILRGQLKRKPADGTDVGLLSYQIVSSFYIRYLYVFIYTYNISYHVSRSHHTLL